MDTNTVGIDTPETLTDLIADARKWPREQEGTLINSLADTVESLTAQLALAKMDHWDEFVEYGIMYRNDDPRRWSWTPNYDDAMRDCANRIHVHGNPLDPIRVVQRTCRILVTEWSEATPPPFDPARDVDPYVNVVSELPQSQ